jgi:hypothetical protein
MRSGHCSCSCSAIRSSRPHEREDRLQLSALIFLYRKQASPTGSKYRLRLCRRSRVPTPADAALRISGHRDRPKPTQFRPRARVLMDASNQSTFLIHCELDAVMIQARSTRTRAQCKGHAQILHVLKTRISGHSLTVRTTLEVGLPSPSEEVIIVTSILS